jgi:hypothetical protein
MTGLPTGLVAFGDQLRDAIALDLERRQSARVRRRRGSRVAVPLAGALVAGLLAALVSAGGPGPSADAAILRHVAAALTAPPATILHERALVTVGSRTEPYELWIQSDPPHRYRVVKWGHQVRSTWGPYTDPAAALRQLVASGHAKVDASTVIDGVPAYELTVAGSPDRSLNGTAFVARDDFRPLLIQTAAHGGERISFLAYEYLPATAANMQLLGSGTQTNR